jgi:adenine deaminase
VRGIKTAIRIESITRETDFSLNANITMKGNRIALVTDASDTNRVIRKIMMNQASTARNAYG